MDVERWLHENPQTDYTPETEYTPELALFSECKVHLEGSVSVRSKNYRPCQTNLAGNLLGPLQIVLKQKKRMLIRWHILQH